MATPGRPLSSSAKRERPSQRRWALLRLVLGFLQVFGASLGVGLLLQTGVTTLSLLVVTLTGLCTTVSVVLFGGRRSKP
jgi:hypothetical protein